MKLLNSSFTTRLLTAGWCVMLCALIALAQAPTGTISGTVIDASGAVIRDANVTVKNKATGAERKLSTDDAGNFAAPSLVAGEYEVSAQAKGFRTTLREFTVGTGSIVRAEMQMEVGQQNEIVTVAADGQAQINYESHSVDGVITRQKIQELPLNGRSFLNLAFLEPGVTVGIGSTSQYNALFSVSILGGSSARTAITIDGGNVRNSIEGGTGMNFSQEIVQEFQLSSTNFDLSTGITSTGSVNVVSRTGGNAFHGGAYFFFRDHNMAAYPALQRNPLAPDPFFARRNPGVTISGPIVKNRLFFFSNYEYTNQAGLVTFQPNLPSAAGLTGNFSNPYKGKQFSTRVDFKINDKHLAYARLSTDWNRGFGPNGGPVLPSNWLQNTNKAIQGLIGFTSTLKPTLVNDARFNYTYWRNRNLFPDSTVCPDCVGLNFPQLSVNGTNVTIGNTSNATQGRNLRRFTFTDNLTWIKGSHRFRFGTELEHAPGTGFWGFCDPFCTAGLSPEDTRRNGLAALFPTLPTVLRTGQDFLNLPFLGASVGIGDPSQPPPFNIDKAKQNNRMRFHAQDTWKVKSNFTLNYGLAWNFESTLVNKDLDKPAYLAPLYGSDLSATKNNYKNFSPSLGMAWNVGKDNKTVIRAGAGIYWDTEELFRRLQERAAIGPVGNGRLLIPHTSFTNIFSTSAQNLVLFIDPSNGRPTPLPNGAPLPASGIITSLTIAQFIQIYNAQIGAMRPTISSDLSVRNIQRSKTAAQLLPLNYPVQRSYQMNFGVQRDLGHDMVLTVDLVRRVFVNTLLGELDYNRFNRFVNVNGVPTQSPVIPRCTAAQSTVVTAQCSNGAITFWTPGGRQVYNGILTKLDKRFSKRYLFTASYALTKQHGNNGVVDLDDYFASYGPQGARHILNVSGLVDLPWGFSVGMISAMSSRGPLTPSISNVDLDGDGIATEPIPGVKFNCFNRGCGKSDLATAVANFNTQFAGKRDARGQAIPTLVLPANYEFGDSWFSSQDLRLTKTFKWGGDDRYKIAIFGEMFNVFNTANLGGYSFNLNNTATFGQPTSRSGQIFGSGGPRALQVGGRVSF
ncbi:MAG: TonB-dependent receptor [Acidobacteria bacterium]|nr:TonB-dependent receptor [Acidobacteriota bacterium]